MNIEKSTIIKLLDRFISQRSGMEWADYGSRESYMGDYRRILKDGKTARRLLRDVELSSITAEALSEAFRAYAGRLALIEDPNTEDGARLEYCTGQYFPTEYRAAACAVLASALWEYHRNDYPAIEDLRKRFAKHYGRDIANRWF